MNDRTENGVAAGGRRHWTDRSIRAGRGAGGSRPLATRAAAMLAIAALILPPNAISEAQAQRIVSVSGAKRTAAIMVPVGKTEDVRIDAPLQRRHGRRSRGRRRHSADRSCALDPRQEDRHHAGHDLRRRQAAGRAVRRRGVLRHFAPRSRARAASPAAASGCRRSTAASCCRATAPDAATLDKAVVIARQFAPDIINTVQVAAAAAGHAGGALRRGQPYGRPRARRAVEHLRQEYADQYRFAGAQRSAARHSPGWAIPAAAPDDQRSGRSGRRQEHPRQPAADLADRRCRRVGDASSAVRLPAGHAWLAAGFRSTSPINALEEKGLARSLAEPNLVALSGDTASFLAGGEYPDPGAGRARHRHHRIQEATASASPSRRPC